MQKYSHPAVKHLDKMCESEELAVCHWKMIQNFEVSTVFVSEEVCLLWVRARVFFFIVLDVYFYTAVNKRVSQRCCLFVLEPH